MHDGDKSGVDDGVGFADIERLVRLGDVAALAEIAATGRDMDRREDWTGRSPS
nr:hypothetical protein GCM10020093_108990 [Planobispora longispora]